jgi:hypothetical protein
MADQVKVTVTVEVNAARVIREYVVTADRHIDAKRSAYENGEPDDGRLEPGNNDASDARVIAENVIGLYANNVDRDYKRRVATEIVGQP